MNIDQLLSRQIGKIRIDASDYRTILWCNDKFLEMLGYTKEQFAEEIHDCYKYMHPEDFNRVIDLAKIMNGTDNSVSLEIRVYNRLKEERIWAVTLCYISEKESSDGISSFYFIVMDITAERQEIQKFELVVENDPLTGVLSRTETEKQIKDYLQSNYDRKGALFMIDTDDFKSINDTKGHIIGDMVLTEMAKGMKQMMRDDDIVGRMGGDEFIIFMKNVSEIDNIKKKAKELTEMFNRLFEGEKSAVQVSCSIGISIYPKNGTIFKQLYSHADKALYQVKKQGKNAYLLYDDISLNDRINSSYISNRTKIETNSKNGNIALINYIFDTLYESDDLEQSINTVLDIIGKRFEVSRAYIFENSEDNLYTSNTYEWCNEGITPEIANLQEMSFHEHGNYEQLFSEDSIFYCRDIHTLKPEQEKLLSMQGICSTLQCAILDDKIFTGMIGFDECTGLRLWTQEEINLLIIISQLISLFLQKKKFCKIKHNINNYQNLLDNLTDCFIVIEKESHILLYSNLRFRDLYSEYKLGHEFKIDFDITEKKEILWNRKNAFLCRIKK